MSKYNINFNFTFKNTEATEPIKEYAAKKIGNSIKKYVHQDIDANVIFDVEKQRQITEVSLNCYGTNFTSESSSDNLYKSIDSVADTLSARLRKQKEKTTDHH